MAVGNRKPAVAPLFGAAARWVIGKGGQRLARELVIGETAIQGLSPGQVKPKRDKTLRPQVGPKTMSRDPAFTGAVVRGIFKSWGTRQINKSKAIHRMGRNLFGPEGKKEKYKNVIGLDGSFWQHIDPAPGGRMLLKNLKPQTPLRKTPLRKRKSRRK